MNEQATKSESAQELVGTVSPDERRSRDDRHSPRLSSYRSTRVVRESTPSCAVDRPRRRYGEKLRYCLPRHSPGEKITTSSPSLDLVLANITLYWLTQTASTSLYYYRSTHGRDVDRSKLFSSLMHKPVGYSLFPKEMLPTPIVWARTRVNLVWSRRHGSVSGCSSVSARGGTMLMIGDRVDISPRWSSPWSCGKMSWTLSGWLGGGEGAPSCRKGVSWIRSSTAWSSCLHFCTERRRVASAPHGMNTGVCKMSIGVAA